MGPGESTAHARMVSAGIVGLLSMSDDDNRTVGVGHAVLADRAEQEARHLTVTTAADDQEVGAPRCVDQRHSGRSPHAR